jgi:hypothetical protein
MYKQISKLKTVYYLSSTFFFLANIQGPCPENINIKYQNYTSNFKIAN